MSSETSALKRTKLYNKHTNLGAKMVPFAGYEMPVQYTGLAQEHHAVRNSVGVFDVSHMGEFIVSGTNAKIFLQNVTTNDIQNLEAGKVQYSAFCNDSGGVIDDLLVYHLGDCYMLVVNASNIEKNFEWLSSKLIDDVSLEDKSDTMSLLALQGPLSSTYLKKLYPKI